MTLEFTPHFRHLVTLIICVAVFGAGGNLLEQYTTLSGILYGCAAFCSVVGVAWIQMLMAERATQRAVLRQDADTASMRAVAEFARAIEAKLPPAVFLETLARAFPGLDLDSVSMPDDVGPQATENGWQMKRGIPWGLATADQYRQLAREYFDDLRGLPVRYWTETQPGQAAPVFSRPQFDKILDELVKNGLAAKGSDGVTRLNKTGDDWLYTFYTPSPTGFSPIRG